MKAPLYTLLKFSSLFLPAKVRLNSHLAKGKRDKKAEMYENDCVAFTTKLKQKVLK